MDNKQKELRKINVEKFEIRENQDSKEKVITGYINKFNTRSCYMGFYEEVAKGAFDKTLSDGHNIYALYNHNDNMVLGATRNNSLKLYCDDVGLKFELTINDNLSYANDVYELVKNGTIEGCSFGFYVLNDEWTYTDDKVDLRILKEIELLEVTITPFPAYLDSEAQCRSYKLHKEELENKELKRKLELELELL